MAVSFGFAFLPSALAYLVGIIGCLLFHSAAPISFQAETVTLAGVMGKDRRERLTIVLLAGLAMTILGIVGVLDDIVAFAGDALTAAMMSGVALMLCKISIDMTKQDKTIGLISMVSGIAVYLFTQNVGYSCITPLIICAIAARFFKNRPVTEEVKAEEKFSLLHPVINLHVIRGVLAVMCITIGGNIVSASMTSSMANMPANPNHISIYSGMADAVSSLFGGSPISVVISPTATAPNPVISAVILMAIMMVLLLTKTLPKVIKLIPPASVAGVLFVLGAFVTLPGNLTTAYSGGGSNALACSMTLAGTALVDPFVGLLAGIVTRAIAMTLGLG